MHLFLDDKMISEFPESSKQCFAFLSIYSNMISKTRFFGIRASQDAIVEITWTFWKKWCFMDLLWLTSSDWQLFAAHNWLRLVTVSHYVNSSVKFDIRFTNDSANLAYVLICSGWYSLMQSHLQQLHIFEETVILRWYDLLGLPVIYLSICASPFVDKFHRVCKCLKVLEKENTTVPFWDLPVYLPLSYNNIMLLKCFFLVTSVTLTLLSFLVIRIFCMTWGNGL